MVKKKMTKFDYHTLKEQLTHRENVELLTEVDVTLNKVMGYTVNDSELPTLFFDAYNRIEAETTRDYLENNHRTDLVNRKILQIWFRNDCKKEIENYLINSIDYHPYVVATITKKPNHRTVELEITHDFHVYMEEIMKLLGLFPNEFQFRREENQLKCIIYIGHMEINDKILRRCEYE